MLQNIKGIDTTFIDHTGLSGTVINSEQFVQSLLDNGFYDEGNVVYSSINSEDDLCVQLFHKETLLRGYVKIDDSYEDKESEFVFIKDVITNGSPVTLFMNE